LHCNEVMLLPYYIASMNIEHEYFEQTGKYAPFEGICMVDTFELAESQQLSLFTPENTIRLEKQKESSIFIILGNPPYNTAQVDENDNNKNRKYKRADRKGVDDRISDTYAKDSKATLLSKLSDPYVKAIRWASDRIADEGIVAFVTNNSFLDKKAFDAMRKHLLKDFNAIYCFDLKGDIRQDSMRDGIPLGEEHTIFGLSAMVGIAITFLVKKRNTDEHRLFYSEVDWRAKRKDKFVTIENAESLYSLEWQELFPDNQNNWLTQNMSNNFPNFIALGSKEVKSGNSLNKEEVIFRTYSLGVSTNRDSVVYDFNLADLLKRIETFCTDYNTQLVSYHEAGKPLDIDGFLSYENVKWSRNLKRALKNYKKLTFDASKTRLSLYRPFTKRFLYFDDVIVDELGNNEKLFPNIDTEKENKLIAITNHSQLPFLIQAINCIPCMDVGGRPTQCFPFYTYDEDGTNRKENITDWALEQFQTQYKDSKITKWDIFYYTYALLHHPQYRDRYAANLKRELPRIPFAPEFYPFAIAGKRLTEIHVNYEQQPEYRLKHIENKDLPIDWRVEKMRLSKDKTQIKYNDFLTLTGIPSEALEYRLGNRSALNWIVDQYQVSTDKRSGITNDPNRLDDEEYIVRLIKQVITVSLETVKIVKSLPDLGLPQD